MEFIQPIIFNVALLFIMMIPGVLMKKCKLMPEGFGKGLSKLVLYIAQPALIFMAYLREFDPVILINSLWIFLIALGLHVIFSVVALLSFKRAPSEMRKMLRFATIFSNAAFMGIPLIGAVLEDTFPGATMYASIYNIVFNLFLWSLGVYICNEDRDTDGDGEPDQSYLEDFKEVHTELIKEQSKHKSHKEIHLGHIFLTSMKKALLHPVTLAAALGLVFFILPIEGYVPALITDSLTMLKNLVAPLSMVVIGIRLADIKWSGIFKDKYMYLFLLYRHVALPLVSVGICKLLPLIGLPIDDVLTNVTVILAAAPAASSATMFAEQYDCDAVYTSRLVTVSTLLSIVTMPLVLFLL